METQGESLDPSAGVWRASEARLHSVVQCGAKGSVMSKCQLWLREGAGGVGLAMCTLQGASLPRNWKRDGVRSVKVDSCRGKYLDLTVRHGCGG